MSRTGRAVVYDAPNAPFQVREYPVRDVRPGEVLVRITMSTICRSDIHSYQGHRPNPCPGILGHEIIGVIEQIGAGVGDDMRGDTLATGDRVTWTGYFADGPSYYRDVHDMPQKAPGLRKYGHDLVEDDPHFLGGFADYCYILPGTGILKLPDELSDEEATPLNCGVATMLRRDGTLPHQGLELIARTREWIKALQPDLGPCDQSVPAIQTMAIPVLHPKTEPLAPEGILFTGDAASLVDPHQGHGIDRALESGALAAMVILQGREDDVAAAVVCRRYEQRLAIRLQRWRRRWQDLDREELNDVELEQALRLNL